MSENTCRYLVLEHRRVLALTGEDRVSFLQGLVSNDVTKASTERALWTAFLSPQGKYLHDFFLIDSGERLLFAPEAERAEDSGHGAHDHHMAALLDLPETPGAARPWGGGLAFMDPRLADMGGLAFLPLENLEETLAGAGFSPGAQQDYDARRVALGLPDGSRDLEVDKTLLLEAGFDELKGIDWKKGCYMGQELTARTKYRGLVKRRLLPVTYEGGAPEEGAAITQSDKEVGRVRSVAGGRALAELRLSALEKLEEAPITAGEVPLAPALPGWLHLPKTEKA
ncbi:MAG: hypothetical protein P8X61_12425 [Limibacillus sp.]